jgi:hypothetical protein
MSTDADLPDAESSIGIWYDLERALEGTNGYGGDVAEIYAYRLLPGASPVIVAKYGDAHTAALAAHNLTWLVRHFVGMHEDIEIGLENGPREFRPIDLRTEEFPPFSHRIHIRVSQERRIRGAFASKLLELRNRMNESATAMPVPEYDRWFAVTSDLLQALGAKVESLT